MTPVLPRSTGGGSFIRAGATIKALAHQRRVRVVLVTGPGSEIDPTALDDLRGSGVEIIEVPDTQLRQANRFRRLVADALSFVSPRAANLVVPPFGIDAIDRPDGDVWCFKSRLLAGRRVPTHGRVVVDLDDLDERVLPDATTARQRRHRLVLVARRRRIVGTATISLVCSDIDRRRLHDHPRVAVLPNTYLLDAGAPRNEIRASTPPAEQCSIVAMVGRMGYEPNADGARWFASECWPLVRAQHPAAKCHLIGRDAHRLGIGDDAGITVIDEVADVSASLRDVSVVVVPILRGSGTRVKILEAMALGIPVVSTTVGAEGLHVTDGEHLVSRDTPEGFAEAVAALLADRERAAAIGQAGRSLFEAEYAFARFRARVDGVLDRLTARN